MHSQPIAGTNPACALKDAINSEASAMGPVEKNISKYGTEAKTAGKKSTRFAEFFARGGDEGTGRGL